MWSIQKDPMLKYSRFSFPEYTYALRESSNNEATLFSSPPRHWYSLPRPPLVQLTPSPLEIVLGSYVISLKSFNIIIMYY